MASQNKKRKLKNNYLCGGALKEKDETKGLKRILFFTSATRKENKRKTKIILDNADNL